MALQQASQKIKNIYETYYTKHEKDFIHLIQYIQDEVSLAEVECSIEELRSIHPNHVTTDKIKVLCAKNQETAIRTATFSTFECEIAGQAKEQLRMYDDLFHTHTQETEEVIA